MPQEAAIPRGLWGRIEKLIDEKIAAFARSGPLRNASISGGAGLTIKDGGVLRLQAADGTATFYVGPIQSSPLPDGSPQPGMVMRRNDGSAALALYDPDPAVNGYNQFLGWFDRSGNVVVSDDTDSGQGIARPYVPFTAYPARNQDWPVVSGTSWVTLYRAKGPKQQPKLFVEGWVNAVTAGAVGEMRVLVNGTVWDTVKQSTPGFVTGLAFGPATVSGEHMSTLTIEIQARLASGSGDVQACAARVEGRQS